MKRLRSTILLPVLALAIPLLAAGCSSGNRTGKSAPTSSTASADQSLVGRYEFNSNDESHFELYVYVTIREEQGQLALDFHGAHAVGSGVAPDGTGTGQVDSKGVYRFSYKDSFNNRGTGTFHHTLLRGYELSFDINHVADSRCMMFYGDYYLQRTRIHW